MQKRRAYRALNIAVLTIVAAAAVFILLTPFRRFTLHIDGRCPLQSFAGIPCPLCGLTSACYAVLTGNVARGIGSHPLTAFVFVLGGFEILARAVLAARPPRESATARIVRLDSLLHTVLVALYLLYALGFLAAHFMGH